jgi:hypothetical protein
MEMQKFATSKEKIGVFFEEITKGAIRKRHEKITLCA